MGVLLVLGDWHSPYKGSLLRISSNLRVSSFILLICLGILPQFAWTQRSQTQCYRSNGRPQMCVPDFGNSAFNNPVEATNTCGERGPTEYCLQTGHTGLPASCHICDANDIARAHPTSYLTDFHSQDNVTWWQSETIYEDVQFPNTVNLTVKLGKTFDITYVNIKFYTSRPESFVLYKRTSDDSEWTPYQYYSASCHPTYGVPLKQTIMRDDETLAICTNDFSDISPLNGGNVYFSTLEGRPSAYQFDRSPQLQEWVKAKDIMVSLTRLNTFGDEIFGDANVLRSYYYAITDISIGARCSCNGHSGECYETVNQYLERELKCRCEHRTDGPDCEMCEPFYNDQPWKRASEADPFECKPCNCNGLSNKCYFDPELYEATGHGGHCTDCREFTDGPHCENCRENFYRRALDNRCMDCQCNPIGSRSLQCDDTGRCQCKPGVTGEKCDRCQAGFYDMGADGCRECGCAEAGSFDNTPQCNAETGQCRCKEHVEGRTCDRCKPGFFYMNEDNKFGCIPCFCFGHSSVCDSAPDYVQRTIGADFVNGAQKWFGVDKDGEAVQVSYNAVAEAIGLSAEGNQVLYFSAPSRFLGDRRFSYNQYLEFTLRIGEDGGNPTRYDVVLEGAAGKTASLPIYAQRQPMPRTVENAYKFLLNEHSDYLWSPSMTSVEFLNLLSNLTAIKVRGTYMSDGVGFLHDVKLGSARRGQKGDPAPWVEECTCPEGYVGQYCEDCTPGYRREPRNGSQLDKCVPCQCYNHSDYCDVNTGRCICEHNTEGDNCERCISGYYGNPRDGTPDDCQVCPCPEQGPCTLVKGGEVACLNCPEGYAGYLCDVCQDGYFGDPQGQYGQPSSCEKCVCNDNIDPNAVGNCDQITGECLKCIYNTVGVLCEQCLPSFYGSALTSPKPGCKACDCYPAGTVSDDGETDVQCDLADGRCPCKSNVVGRQCEECARGFWNIDSGNGCETCNCDPIGSVNETCHIRTGQCFCRPGVGGLKCDECLPLHFGFSNQGCQLCECDPIGSKDEQCAPDGQCPCHEGVANRRCDQCEENKYDMDAGCIDCPPCYGLVQKRVNSHREKLAEIEQLLIDIDANPPNISDQDFEKQLKQIEATVTELLEDAEDAAGKEGGLGGTMDELREKIDEIMETAAKVTAKVVQADEASKEGIQDIAEAEDAVTRAEDALNTAQEYIEKEGKAALDEAQEASDKFGMQSDRMSEIAREARVEADRQEKEAAEIEKVANEALNTSREAYKIAYAAIQGQGQTTDDIEKLRNQYYDAEELFDRTKKLAENARKQAGDVYDEVLEMLTNANSLQLPEADSESYRNQAESISKEAQEITDEATNLIADNEELLETIDEQKAEAEQLLEDGIKQQQVADEMLADVNKAKGQAEAAVAMGEQTLKEANETLQTLNDFDNQVKESEGKAKEAMEKVGEIEELIEEAESTTQDAEDLLANAEQDANTARDIARQAQKVAEGASQDAEQIREDAASTKDRAEQLKEETDSLAEEVSGVEELLITLENQTVQDEELAKQALEKADQAKQLATDSSTKVKEALDSVNKILEDLDKLDSVDEDRLNELEAELENAQQILKEAKLDERLEKLRKANEQQSHWVKDYSAELEQLRRDVNNIEDIRNSLPDGCFRTEVLEPIG